MFLNITTDAIIVAILDETTGRIVSLHKPTDTFGESFSWDNKSSFILSMADIDRINDFANYFNLKLACNCPREDGMVTLTPGVCPIHGKHK